ARVTYPNKFLKGVKEYFDAIFAPFRPYARAGLDKLDAIAFDMACVSHGPVLTQQGMLPEIRRLYREWSAEEERAAPLIPVFYTSAYGYTKQLAEAAVVYIKEKMPTAQTEAYDIIEHDMAELAAIMNRSNGFMIGSPTINKDAVPPVWELLSKLDGIGAQKKPIGVFGSYGWSGEAIPALVGRLSAIRTKVIGEGYKATFCPSAEELQAMRDYTQLFLDSITLK
ncbi:MAG: flavodoxin domain-containing protein, partial [Clostridia bacterium]